MGLEQRPPNSRCGCGDEASGSIRRPSQRMTIWPVDKRVGNVRNHARELSEPAGGGFPMSDFSNLFPDFFPSLYQAPSPPEIRFVILNWLSVEVPAPQQLMPTLSMLSGWRREEVIGYLESYDWTAQVLRDMNGPGAVA
jgi:hypothetical protein